MSESLSLLRLTLSLNLTDMNKGLIMSATLTASQPSISSRLQAVYQRLAYHHKKAEFVLYLMFISGLLLWPMIDIAWQVERLVLLMHMLAGLTIFPIFVGSFWLSHRRLLKGNKKEFLRKTGSIIEYLLVACTLSGIYLTFWGNTGNNLSIFIQDIHFYSSWLLAPLVLKHAWRWTILTFCWKNNFRKK